MGPLTPVTSNGTSSGSAPSSGGNRFYSAEAAAPPSEGGLRWARAAALRATEAASASSLALVGGGLGANIPAGDSLAKRLATMFQEELDEYRKGNPDFPVSLFVLARPYGITNALLSCFDTMPINAYGFKSP